VGLEKHPHLHVYHLLGRPVRPGQASSKGGGEYESGIRGPYHCRKLLGQE
jgi:hypothetical protein